MAAVLDRIKQALGGTSVEALEQEIVELGARSRVLQRSRRRFREHSRHAIDQLVSHELRVLEQARDELVSGYQAFDPAPSPYKEQIITIGTRYLALSDPRLRDWLYAGAESQSPEWADVTLEQHEQELAAIEAEVRDRRIELERRDIEGEKRAAAERERALTAKAAS
jgi:hypothetical protein